MRIEQEREMSRSIGGGPPLSLEPAPGSSHTVTEYFQSLAIVPVRLCAVVLRCLVILSLCFLFFLIILHCPLIAILSFLVAFSKFSLHFRIQIELNSTSLQCARLRGDRESTALKHSVCCMELLSALFTVLQGNTSVQALS